MADQRQTEELYRRLEQSRRLVAGANDPMTTERLTTLVNDLENEIAAAEARGADVPLT